jgi:hypothetical protein
MVEPLGIEPSPHVLQTCAQTTYARVLLGGSMGFEPTLRESQSLVLTITLRTTLTGAQGGI